MSYTITAEAVAEAYSQTGHRPVRGCYVRWTPLGVELCPLSVLAVHAGQTTPGEIADHYSPKLDEDVPGIRELTKLRLNVSDDYIDGFIGAVDGVLSEPVEVKSLGDLDKVDGWIEGDNVRAHWGAIGATREAMVPTASL